MKVRARTDADLDSCEQLALAVHDHDGYPAYPPDDLRSFIASPPAIATWVADHDGEIAGHVVLNPASSDTVMALVVGVTGRPADHFGVVARLLVSPRARKRGVGRSLLEVAADHAIQLGLWPMLDVAAHHEGAIGLYERCGWQRAGKVTVAFRHGGSLDEFVYLSPRSPSILR